MKYIKSAIAASALLATLPFFAQERFDVSGTWQMDASRSESAHQAVPIGSITLVIKQTGENLTMETRRSEKGSSVVVAETLTFKLKGVESSMMGRQGSPVQNQSALGRAKTGCGDRARYSICYRLPTGHLHP